MDYQDDNPPSVIEKELIPDLKFNVSEVLKSQIEVMKRMLDLDRAVVLGNNYHLKVKLIFEDEDGYKQVNATILAVTDKHVIFRSCITIPTNRVHKVDVY